MRKIRILILLLSLLIGVGCGNKKQGNTPEKLSDTEVSFTKTLHNFGDIAEGEVVSHTFHFKNTGKESFIIRNIVSGCGCTTVNYDKAPLPPGKEGKLEITFNSSGRYGKQYKEISIFANVPKKEIKLKYIANVK